MYKILTKCTLGHKRMLHFQFANRLWKGTDFNSYLSCLKAKLTAKKLDNRHWQLIWHLVYSLYLLLLWYPKSLVNRLNKWNAQKIYAVPFGRVLINIPLNLISQAISPTTVFPIFQILVPLIGLLADVCFKGYMYQMMKTALAILSTTRILLFIVECIVCFASDLILYIQKHVNKCSSCYVVYIAFITPGIGLFEITGPWCYFPEGCTYIPWSDNWVGALVTGDVCVCVSSCYQCRIRDWLVNVKWMVEDVIERRMDQEERNNRR